MAQSLQLSETALDEVAAGIAPSVPVVFPAELAESFELWEFMGTVTDPALDFFSRLQFRNRYYHQILVNKQPAGYAVSIGDASGNGGLKVAKVVQSNVPKDLDAALDRIDAYAPDDVRVHVLMAEAYYVKALYIADPKRPCINVVCCPPFYKYIRRGVIVEPAEFVAMLAAEQTQGLADRKKIR